MDAAFLKDKFATAPSYARYVETGTDEQQRRWQQVYSLATLTDKQRDLVAGFTRSMNILVVSGVWCGDCVQQCPLIARIAEANNARVDLRFVDRDQNHDLIERVRINAGDRIPVALMMAEDFELCAAYGERTISRYRALAIRQLGAACPTGIAAPDKDELSATLSDWLTEIERVQLMLRLSPRLRHRHGD